MSQYIQLQQVVIDGMVVKMGGNNIGCRIIGRMLHRSEGIDFLSVGQHDDASRVLAGGAAYPYAACHDPVDLAVALVDAPLLKVVFT